MPVRAWQGRWPRRLRRHPQREEPAHRAAQRPSRRNTPAAERTGGRQQRGVLDRINRFSHDRNSCPWPGNVHECTYSCTPVRTVGCLSDRHDRSSANANGLGRSRSFRSPAHRLDPASSPTPPPRSLSTTFKRLGATTSPHALEQPPRTQALPSPKTDNPDWTASRPKVPIVFFGGSDTPICGCDQRGAAAVVGRRSRAGSSRSRSRCRSRGRRMPAIHLSRRSPVSGADRGAGQWWCGEAQPVAGR